MSYEMKRIFGAEMCSFYLYDEWKGDYELYSDREEVLMERISAIDFKDENSYYMEASHLFKQKRELFSYIVPLQIEQKNYGYIMLAFKEAWAPEDQEVSEVAFQVLRFLLKMESYYKTLEEERKYELLYRVTSKFHSSMDMEEVLYEIIRTLKKIYPSFDYHLLLSQDFTGKHELPVKELTYGNDSNCPASEQAYLTGEVQMEDRLENKKSCLYAPLKGKQGVYGVLEVIAPSAMLFPEKDVEFIVLLANTAGNALENARLYQQSKKLVSDLQLVNETSHRLNSNLRLADTIIYMSEQIRKSFHADEVGFVLLNEGSYQRYQVLDGSTGFFKNEAVFPFIKQTEAMIDTQQDAVFIGDYRMKTNDEAFPFQSMMAIPMLEQDRTIGFVIVLHERPYFFPFESFKLLQSLVHHSTLAFANAMLREELEKSVITDYLTKLYSRSYLDQQVQEHMAKDEQGAFLLFDIDDFKKVNDTYGHQVGDEIIIQVASIMKGKLTGKAFAARMGGEELAIYLPDASLEHAEAIANAIREEIQASTKPGITVSCGVSYWRVEEELDPTFVIRQADKALYTAKDRGKNKVFLEDRFAKLH
ncbi:diguanylate cyclase domain-containing protein [Thalassobacillus hwangdonensis]|uniref:Diguanylate cyclase domain-containing protein n=2 Tax=Thalassobacillus hwangdonensis TaxID=546108 RepID=A0ABW3KYV4_9BACI